MILKSTQRFPCLKDVMFVAKVERISFSAPPALLRQFDDSLSAIGYKDRSKALQIAMRNFISEYAWQKETESPGAGVILFTYQHDSHGLQESLTNLQHEFRQIVNSTTHIHLDESNCLEIVSVRGKMKHIQSLARGIMNRRGVMQLKLSTVAV